MKLLPTVPLGNYPTPFEKLPSLTRAIGGARIFVKRDDLTGLAMGGSKTRALSTLIGQAKAQGADTIITCGPTTSNHVRLSSAAANRMGMKAVLVVRHQPGEDADKDLQGNMLLNLMLGAEVIHANVETLAELEPIMARVADDLRQRGRRPFIIPGGGFSPIGAVGYLGLVRELQAQSQAEGIDLDAIVFASGSGCIQSGLTLGVACCGLDVPIFGVTINRSVSELLPRIIDDVAAASELIGVSTATSDSNVRILDAYLGPGYAIPSREGMKAIQMAAELEGLLLDPCYTGKAMAATMDLAKSEFRPGQNIVFIHTGGVPGIFAYSKQFTSHSRHELGAVG